MRRSADATDTAPAWHRPFLTWHQPFGAAHSLVGTARTTRLLHHPWADERLLNASERRRALRFHAAADRDDFTAAHLLVRMCAAQLTGTPVERVAVVQECAECGTEGHGLPRAAGLPGLHLSLSHSRGRVAAAAGYTPVGVDVEGPENASADPPLLARVLNDRERALVREHPRPERAFLRLWVRKEALVKIGAARLEQLAETDASFLAAACTEQPNGPLLTDWWDEGLDAHVALSARPLRRPPAVPPHPSPPPPNRQRMPTP
jgi:4'-phosphopantetheinyl transferase